MDDEFQEGESLEFKEQLPSKDGQTDPWSAGENRISDRARDVILDEIVALANAGAGHIILGIEESDDHPKRAKGLKPLPRCADLANRLRHQARDCVEPALPSFGAVGIRCAADGSGFVVLRVAASSSAPHRTTTTLRSHVRRADRTEKMTMREIQEMTLQRAQGLSRLDARFDDRLRAFHAHVSDLPNGTLGVPLNLAKFGGNNWDKIGPVQPMDPRLPRLKVGPADELQSVIRAVATDLLNAAGSDIEVEPFTVEVPDEYLR